MISTLINKVTSNYTTKLSILAVIVQGLATLGIVWLIKDTLGLELLGFWSLLLSILSIVTLAEFGLGQALIHFSQSSITSDTSTNLSFVDYYQTTLITLAILYISLMFAIYQPAKFFLVSTSGDVVNSNIPIDTILLVSSISMITGILSRVSFSALNGLGFYWVSQLIIVLSNIIYLFSAFHLIKVFGITGLVFAHLAMTSTMLIMGHLSTTFVIVGKRKVLSNIFPIHYKFKCIKNMYRLGLSIQGTSLLLFLLEPVVRASIANIGGLTQLGVYEMASRLLLGLRDLMVRPLGFLSGFIAKNHQVNPDKTIRTVRYYQKKSFFLSIMFFSIILLSAHFLNDYWVATNGDLFLIVMLWLGLSWSINIFLMLPVYFYGIGSGKNTVNFKSILITGIISIIGCLIAAISEMYLYIIIFYGLGLIVGAAFSFIYFDSKHKEETLSLIDTKKTRNIIISLLTFSILMFFIDKHLLFSLSIWLRSFVLVTLSLLLLAPAFISLILKTKKPS